MMLYAVLEGYNYEGRDILAIVSSLDMALLFMENLRLRSQLHADTYYAVPFEVDRLQAQNRHDEIVLWSRRPETDETAFEPDEFEED